MDNWLRFQYYMITELWGRRKKAGAGNGKTGASRGAVEEANPLHKAKL